MRLIDADALLEKVQFRLPAINTHFELANKFVEITRRLISEEPTIDPEELRPKGRWIGKQLDNFRKYQVTCSECGWIGIENYDSYNEPSEFNYCPNCGADMRGGDDEQSKKTGDD